MHMNYLDTFLAFLGMTIGGMSVLPKLFFQQVDASKTSTAGSRDASDRRR